MKNNRIGLILVLSSLAVIALVLAMLLQRQQATEAEQVRVQGLGTMRSLAALPLPVLLPASGQRSVLEAVLAYRDNPNFAYATITDVAGRSRAEVTAPGILVPAPPPWTAASFAERTVPAAGGQRGLREFYAPLTASDGSQLQLRIGYLEPRALLDYRDLPFYAVIALAMFLLVPLIYLVIKREMAPLAAIGEQLRTAATTEPAVAIEPETGSDVRGLALQLNRYLDHSTRRIRELEQASTANAASWRLLEYNTNKMQSMLHCLPDGLLALDPSGDVTFATGKIEHLLGVSVSAVLSQPVEAWCEDAELRTVLLRLRGGRGEGRHASQFDFSPVRVPTKHLSVTVQPLHDGGGANAYGTLVALRDATADHLARQAGNDFVAHVSHELKSPLNVIAMYSETLQSGALDDRASRIEALNVIHDEVERMAALVNNLLNISKIETGSMHPERHRVKLDDLLRDAFHHALPRAESRAIQMDLQIPRELAAVSVDKDLLQIAVNNLLTNAVKYNRDGGSVALSAEEGDNEVVITVRDSGIGIDEKDRERVFQKFYRAPDAREISSGGHGLGLYLAGQIVELHHGRITLDSEVGRGSAFSIHLKKMPALQQGATIL